MYPYYSCQNRDCSKRTNVRKEVIEKQFEEFVESLSVPKRVFKVVETQFELMRSTHEQNIADREKHTADTIKSIKGKQKKIELVLENATNEKLLGKYAQKWSDLEKEIEELEQQELNGTTTIDESKTLVNKAKILFENPYSIRESGDPNIRYLLLAVRC